MRNRVYLGQPNRMAGHQRHSNDDLRCRRHSSPNRGEMMRMLDLFSGLGGASEAFVQNGWEVLRLENNIVFTSRNSDDYVPHTRHWDALEDDYSLIDGHGKVDFVWASPPCYEFSLAYGAPRSVAAREGREWNPSMELLEKTIEVIDRVKPRFWAIENVVGASKYFQKYLGEHRVKLGSAMIWGNFPIVGFVEIEKGWKKANDDSKARYSPIRSNLRAKMPLWMSEQMRVAVQYQMMLSDFEDSLADLSWFDEILRTQSRG